MGLLDGLFGGGTSSSTAETDESSKRKYAILVNAGPDNVPTAANAFNYGLEFDDKGYEVHIYLDGEATKWPQVFEENPEQAFSYDWKRVRDRGLLTGACGYCANAFETADACERSDIEVLSGSGHSPSVGDLAEEGYEILPIG